MAAPVDGSPKSKFQAIYVEKRTPGSWKDKYRKRCFDNLKKNRANLLAKFRHSGGNENQENDVQSSVHSIMAQEWRMLQYEDMDLPDVQMSNEGFKLMTAHNDDFENMFSVFDEIERELMQEEQELIKEYEKSLSHEDDALCEQIERLRTSEVICPICQKFPLLENVNVIFCRCGVRINTEADGLQLRHLSSNLQEGVNLHSACCNQEPVFKVISQTAGIDNIVMTCKGCEFMYIVI